MSDQELEREVLTRLLHAHPEGLGKEVLDNYRGERAVADVLKDLQTRHLIHGGAVSEQQDAPQLVFPIKLSSAGVEHARRLEA